ncbi:MAG: MOSC domain-containing protein [Proteobacteria bacterium]|uniref:MOSC domain-containing protein n=1 Tax=Rudaea sp. TaxID=2136325 RepID=UPI00322020D7|nr:MOSC domain-containing protein [Pseudomonadota bacterium]
MTFSLASIHIYPLKSGAPLALKSAAVETRGLARDRRWMVVDADGKFLTGREHARLTLLRALPNADGSLHLDAPATSGLRVPVPDARGERVATAVWGSPVSPLLADETTNAWLSKFLGKPVRLVHMDSECVRAVDAKYAEPGDEVSLADGFPLLLVSQAALDLLNSKLAAPVPILRFRPNLVVAGTQAHAEDGWKRIRVGEVEFDVVKACVRCVFTTVDFERGERDPSGEPLRTLLGYRRGEKGVTFGQNLIPRATGVIRTGDAVSVIA